METWVIYGILASLSFGSLAVLNKIVLAKGTNPFLINLLMGLGIVGAMAIVFLFAQPSVHMDSGSLMLSILAGILWAVGQTFVILALVNKADVARLVPIFNTNTLVAVALGMILLKELPAGTEKIKVVIGAILIVVGGVLVSS